MIHFYSVQDVVQNVLRYKTSGYVLHAEEKILFNSCSAALAEQKIPNDSVTHIVKLTKLIPKIMVSTS